jgi:outer membrane protein assembly factor BamB
MLRSTPRQRRTIIAGSWQGDAAVVSEATGRVIWRQRTGRELGTLSQDGERWYLALGPLLSLRAAQRRAATQQARQRIAAERSRPTRLEARSLADGALAWSAAHWGQESSLHVELESDTLVAASLDCLPGAEMIYGLDARTGSVRWSVAGSECCGYLDRLAAARGGRVYVHKAGTPHRMHVLDTRTGRDLWSDEWSYPWDFSEHGTLVAKPRPGYVRQGELTLLRAEDGMEIRRAPISGWLSVLTDDGVAYTHAIDQQPAVEAIDVLRDGALLWRVDGLRADRLVLDGDQLCFLRLVQPEQVAEVGALNARTGARLWTWRTPGDTAALLCLWGMRTPAMLADSARRSWQTLASVLAQPDPIQRRGLIRREISRGQWRHPYALHSANNAAWLAARRGLVLVGTRLGLFALDASTGRPRWRRAICQREYASVSRLSRRW